MEMPKAFNILVTGTPGTGKTSLCQMLQDELGLTHVDIGKVVKEEKFFSEYDATYGSNMMDEDDEDRLLDYLEPIMMRGGVVCDFHSSNLFPRRWFGCVLVLRVDTDKIFDRLTARGYSEEKRAENLEAEIQGVCEDEARESYHESCVVVRPSNELTDLLGIVELVGKIRAEWTPAKQEFLTFAEMEELESGDDEDGDDDNNQNQAGASKRKREEADHDYE
jgi:adenylate kinase